MKSLKEFIDTYKDYPKKGIEFKDVLGIIQEPRIFKELIMKMSSSQIIKNSEGIRRLEYLNEHAPIETIKKKAAMIYSEIQDEYIFEYSDEEETEIID